MALSQALRQVDLAIIGAGAAGLSAAAVAAQAGLSVLVIERMGAGGQVMAVERIDNFPGHGAISGYELGPLLQEQAENAGADFLLDAAQALDFVDGRHQLRCGSETIAARAVLLACGSQRRKLGVPGEEAYDGRGVSHCASCDGPLYTGKAVCVAGGGDSALGEALVLAVHAERVDIVFPAAHPHAQQQLVDAVRSLPHVRLWGDARVVEICGDDQGLTGVALQAADGTRRDLPAYGLFVYAGLAADTQFLAGTVDLDADGRIATDAGLQTSLPGVYAAGDARSGAQWLLATAAQEGETAAHTIVRALRTP